MQQFGPKYPPPARPLCVTITTNITTIIINLYHQEPSDVRFPMCELRATDAG